ncbi:phosphoenolpyruvate carboxykinase (GTP), partial [Candidatus Bathyarchaeota archaeon]|nr:phosphoenolpyruvate carboxykinase (GTP) [Candidatus Bathyarchaeota archaeon]
PPKIYSTNYFLKHEGKYTNSKLDKKIWIQWAEGRVNDEFGAIRTPIGYIPQYDDLKTLFKIIFNKDYEEKEYIQQFSIRLSKHLEKIYRIEHLYKDEPNMPKEFWNILYMQKQDLQELKVRTGKDVLPPISFQ